MSRFREVKYRAVTAFQRRVGNPLLRRLPVQTLLETTGRTSGLPRRTPVGGRLVGDAFWFVSEYGERSQYVRNIRAQPLVRVRVKGRWYAGTAHPGNAATARHACRHGVLEPAHRRTAFDIRIAEAPGPAAAIALAEQRAILGVT